MKYEDARHFYMFVGFSALTGLNVAAVAHDYYWGFVATGAFIALRATITYAIQEAKRDS